MPTKIPAAEKTPDKKAAAVRVAEKLVYSDREAAPEERDAGIVYTRRGDVRRPELINREIEDREHRKRIPLGAGNICIGIHAGDELGELSFNVQFEGKSGEREFCLGEQNALLHDVSEWMHEFLTTVGHEDGEFVVTVEGKPCPFADRRLELEIATKHLEGRSHEIEQTQQTTVKGTVATSHQITDTRTTTIKHG
jgi:hypothetical protein